MRSLPAPRPSDSPVTDGAVRYVHGSHLHPKSYGRRRTELLDVTPNDCVGLLVIRAWVEPGSTEPLRAQVRVCTDVSAGEERTLMLARADAVGAAVQEWLAGMLSDVGPSG